MTLSTELKTNAEAAIFAQNNLANWCKIASSVRHSPESGVNTLVDSSAAVFGYIHELTQNPLTSEVKKSILEHLEVLQKHYQQLGYSQDISLAAHYTLCATLDDILRCVGNDGQFLQSFHNSRLEQEKFYSILEHIRPQSDKYIDLLELMYLCLRFGYKGQYRSTPFGLQQWSFLADNTYRLITETRGQHSHVLSPNLSSFSLSKMLPPSTRAASNATQKHRRFYVLTLVVFIVLAAVSGLVFRQTYNATREGLLADNVATSHQQQEVAA